MNRWNRYCSGTLALPAAWLGASLVFCQTAAAQMPPQPTYTVTTILDAHDLNPGDGQCYAAANPDGLAAGECTLRAAIEENEAKRDWGIIELPGEFYAMKLGTLTISTSVTIKGEDVRSTTLSMGGQRGFLIKGADPFNVWMSNFILAGANITDPIGRGGGGGMSIESEHANVSLYRLRIANNNAEWRGAGIYNTGYLNVSECVFADNLLPRRAGIGVTGSGAGIYNDIDGTLILSQSTFTGNIGTRGGGVFNTGRMTMTNCTLRENKVSLRGGAVFNEISPKNNGTIAYSTIVANQVGIPVEGNSDNPNTPDISGGGIYNNGSLYMGKTILADNIDETKSEYQPTYSPDCYSGPDERSSVIPTFVSYRDNIISRFKAESCNLQDQNLGAPLDHTGTEQNPKDPMLDFINTNGGVGRTQEPKPGSLAIQHAVKGLGSLPPCPSTDQRGAPRPVLNAQGTGEGCTIGAFQIASTSTAFEAEHVSRIGGEFYQVIDNSASANAYLWTDANSPNQLGVPTENSRIRFTFYVDQAGYFKFQGTTRASSTDHNSFWARIDGYPNAAYRWDVPVSGTAFASSYVSDRGNGTEAAPQYPEISTYLERGVHTVDVYLRENQTQIDKMEMVPAPVPQMSVEMETAYMQGFFIMGYDPLASLGKFVYAPTGVTSLSAPNPLHSVSTTVNVATAGTYLIKGSVRAEGTAHNSFWVKVDGLPSNGYLWDMTEDHSTYSADYVSNRGTGDAFNPQFDAVELNLTAGPHTIEVFAREDGARLDKIGFESKAAADARIISRNKTAHSSSNESGSYLPANAFDGTTATRWSSQFSDNQWIKVDLGSTYDIDRVVLDWEAAYAEEYEIQISNDAENWNTLYHKDGNTGGIDNIMASGRGRYVRMLGIHRGTQYGYSLREFTVYGEAAVGGDVNFCSGKTATTSSNQDANTTGAKAVDANLSTRWSTNFSDDQWIYVDLGVKRDLNRVKLRWESAYGKSYEIKVSDDASEWTTLFSTTNGNGNLDDLSVTGSGRYVKMRGVQRGTSYGYSLYEFEAYGK